MVHHFATVAVIFLSYMAGFVRVGMAVMCLLDVADVPLHIAKQFVYLAQDASPKEKDENGKVVGGPETVNQPMQTIADLWFVLFAISFMVTRLGMYPYIVWSSIWEKSAVDCQTCEHLSCC